MLFVACWFSFAFCFRVEFFVGVADQSEVSEGALDVIAGSDIPVKTGQAY